METGGARRRSGPPPRQATSAIDASRVHSVPSPRDAPTAESRAVPDSMALSPSTESIRGSWRNTAGGEFAVEVHPRGERVAAGRDGPMLDADVHAQFGEGLPAVDVAPNPQGRPGHAPEVDAPHVGRRLWAELDEKVHRDRRERL